MDKIILYLENDDKYRRPLSTLLRRHGYDVIEAGTIEAAHAALQQHFVHLILVDIRMVDDDDPNDVSGLDFAQEAAYLRLPKISSPPTQALTTCEKP